MSATHDATVPLDQVTELSPQFAELGVTSKVGVPTLRIGKEQAQHGYAWAHVEFVWADVTLSLHEDDDVQHRQMVADIGIALRDAGYKVVIAEKVETTL